MGVSWSRWTAALAVLTLAVSACSKAGSSKRAVDRGIVAIQQAAAEPIPGAKEDSSMARFSDSPPGSGVNGGGDGYRFGTATSTARYDWSTLIADAPLGIAGLVVDQADAQARVLRKSGFEPLDAGASVFNRSAAPDAFAVSASATNRRHGWSCPRDVERLQHRRIYHAPGTGAFVVARIDYDGRDHTAAVEMTYVETTVDARYPAENGVFSETVSKMPPRKK